MMETMIREIPIAEVRPSRWQYRRIFDPDSLLELTRSIDQHGLINAILVFKHEASGFELIAGERRLRACLALALAKSKGNVNLAGAVALVAGGQEPLADSLILLGDHEYTIRAEVRPGTAEDWHQAAVIENLQRENPSPIEEAEAFSALMDVNGWDQKALAGHLSKSTAYISQRMGLLDLSDRAKSAVHSGAIPFSSARVVATVPEPLQGQLTEQLIGRQSQLTTREVQSLGGQVKRFFDPDRWQPAEDDVIDASTRNAYRLIRYHMRYMMDHDADRAEGALIALQRANSNVNLLGSRPATIAGRPYYVAQVLNALTGGDTDPYEGIKPFWRPFALAQGYTCEQCQYSGLEAPTVDRDPNNAPCVRWRGEEITTCPAWLGDGDPVVFFLSWQLADTVKDHGDGRFSVHDAPEVSNYGYLADLEQVRDLLDLANRIETEADAERDRQTTHGYLDRMLEYWQAQPHGIGSIFVLTHAQAHSCRYCKHYDPAIWDDPGWAPCEYTVEPLRGHNGPRAPKYGVLVRSDGAMVPRCERFHVAEMPAICPVKGVRFPDDKAGRAVVLGWLERGVINKIGFNDRQGTMPGPLAWLPYDREPSKLWDLALMLAWIREHWAECGGDPGVARLISVGISEQRARDDYDGPFDLMNPITGEIERWAALGWHDWRAGKVPYSYPENWPRPEGVSDGKKEGSDQ